MDFQDAVTFLKKFVKESAVPGQKHISPDLVNANELPQFQEAMTITNNAVVKGEITREELTRLLGV